MAKKLLSKTIMHITDDVVAYLTLERDDAGYFVNGYESAELAKGVVEKGEILKAEFLQKIITAISRKISNTTVDLIIPHEYFFCKEGELRTPVKKESIRDRVKKYFQSLSETEEWQKTHICEFSTYPQKPKDKVLFRCLPKDMYQSYDHVFKKSGLGINVISSEVIALDILMPKQGRSVLISVQNNATLVTEFRNGIYQSLKKFQLSYQQLHDDIKKNIHISNQSAHKILEEYGVLRLHKDEKVYKRLLQSMSPMLDFLNKRKSSDSIKIFVSYDGFPLKGLVDVIAGTTKASVEEVDVLNLESLPFHEVLTLHKKSTYRFAPLIAQALKHWQKDS